MAGIRKHHLTRQEVLDVLEKHGTITAAAKALKMPYSSLQDIVRKEGINLCTKVAPRAKSKALGCIGLSELLAKHNPIQIFQEQLAEVPKGMYIPDHEMLQLCGLSKADWSKVKRSDKTRANKVVLPDRSIVWASEEDAANARRKLLEV